MAYSWESGLAGAGSGALQGGMMGGPWGAVAGGALGALGGFGGSEPQGPTHGIDVAYIDDYADYAGIRDAIRNSQIGALQGDIPEWYGNYSDALQGYGEQDINRYYLGEPGYASNSALGLAQQADAVMGTGRGSASQTARTKGAISDMAAKKAALSQMFLGNKLNFATTNYQNAPGNLLGLPQGQRYYAAPWSTQGDAGSPSFFEAMAPAVGSMIGSTIGSKYLNPPNMGGGGYSQYGNYYGNNTPKGVYDTGQVSMLGGR